MAILPHLKSFAIKLTRDGDKARDLMQDTAALALANRHQFRPGTSLRAWLFTIMRNKFIAQRKHEKLIPMEEFIERHESYVPLSPSPEDGFMAAQELMMVKCLPKNYADAISAALSGDSYEDIAARIGVSVNTLRNRVWRGRERLRRLTEVEP